jgi:hypothetical protein
MKFLGSLPIPILFLALAAGGSPANAQRASHPSYELSYNRFGPLKIGMTIPIASKALGVPLVREEGYDDRCHYVRPKSGFKGISFMVTNGRISRVDVEDRSYRTIQGAKIGDTEAHIKHLYAGRVRVTPHKYVDWAHYLIVEFRDGKFLIVFETDGKRVTSYRVGKNPEAGYVEGCS